MKYTGTTCLPTNEPWICFLTNHGKWSTGTNNVWSLLLKRGSYVKVASFCLSIYYKKIFLKRMLKFCWSSKTNRFQWNIMRRQESELHQFVLNKMMFLNEANIKQLCNLAYARTICVALTVTHQNTTSYRTVWENVFRADETNVLNTDR